MSKRPGVVSRPAPAQSRGAPRTRGCLAADLWVEDLEGEDDADHGVSVGRNPVRRPVGPVRGEA